MIKIRPEQQRDIQGIHDVTVAAFSDAPHTDHTEQFIVRALRDAGALSVSLVAEYDGVVVGHIALSPVTIADGSEGWYGLGPLSVMPSYQGKSIGSSLMHTAIEALKSRQAKGCVLLGDPAYYQQFGFEPKAELVLSGVPPAYFQVLVLDGELPQGEVSYHAAFAATS